MRVVRTFGFVDLCGFTAYTECHGDERAVAMLATLRSSLRAGAERCGVRVMKWLGDGAMVTAGDPQAVVECVALVRDVMATESPLALRGGIAMGPAILFEGEDYIGAAVNVAARLSMRASPNQILVTSDVLQVAANAVTLRPLQTIRVAGLAEPIKVRELAGTPTSERLQADRR